MTLNFDENYIYFFCFTLEFETEKKVEDLMDAYNEAKTTLKKGCPGKKGNFNDW